MNILNTGSSKNPRYMCGTFLKELKGDEIFIL